MEKRTLKIKDILGCNSCMFAKYEITFDYDREKNLYSINPETIENKQLRNMFDWKALCSELKIG